VSRYILKDRLALIPLILLIQTKEAGLTAQCSPVGHAHMHRIALKACAAGPAVLIINKSQGTVQ